MLITWKFVSCLLILLIQYCSTFSANSGPNSSKCRMLYCSVTSLENPVRNFDFSAVCDSGSAKIKLFKENISYFLSSCIPVVNVRTILTFGGRSLGIHEVAPFWWEFTKKISMASATMYRSIYIKVAKSTIFYTVYENHRKSLIQHCERSELGLHFELPKVRGRSFLIGQKLVENAKNLSNFQTMWSVWISL